MVETRTIDAMQLQILDQLSDVIAIFDARQPSLPLIALNHACRALLSTDIAAPIGAPWEALFPPTSGDDLPTRLRQARATGETSELAGLTFINVANANHSGMTDTTYWDWKCQPLRDARGQVDQLMVTLRDVTPRERAAQTQRLTDQLIDQMPLGLVVTAGPHHTIGRINAAFCRLVGKDAAALVDQSLFSAAPELGASRLAALMTETYLSGVPLKVESLPLAGSAGQERRWAVRVLAIPGPTRRIVGFLLLVSDVTADREADRERDAFLSLISHEIKSPLTSIKGFSQLALRAIEADDQPLRRAEKHLRVIEQQADRIGRLIGDLSDVSRLQRGKLLLDPTVFDLVPLVRTSVDGQRAHFGAHRLDLALTGEPLIVRADPHRIRQILTVLLENAAKFSPLADRIAVTLEQRGDAARLAVRDWGMGIAAEEQPRIFERFYRAPGGGGSGLGLGLFIARQIAQRGGGDLSVESMPGAGSTFRLELPLARPDPADEE